MKVGEFDLIDNYFSGLQGLSPGVVLGIGDDAAVLELAAKEQLVVSTDTLVAGVHFPVGLDAEHIAARTLLTNISDLAAMGAEPRWFTLALTLPEANREWLAGFSAGLSRVARAYRCALVGGDTTSGPLTVTITVHGVVPEGRALTRNGAKPGDIIFVSGAPGLGAAGLAGVQGKLALSNELQQQQLCNKFLSPEPRLDVGQQLRGIASAAIDISDGLLADLGHICERSGVGANVQLGKLPELPWLSGQVSPEQQRQWVLSGGDDYELCFTAAADDLSQLERISGELSVPFTAIGEIVAEDKVVCLDQHGQPVAVATQGYQHF